MKATAVGISFRPPPAAQTGLVSGVDVTVAVSAVRLCKDCRYYLPQQRSADLCGHPRHGTDLVRGERVQVACSFQRERPAPADRSCGREGHWFEREPEGRPA